MENYMENAAQAAQNTSQQQGMEGQNGQQAQQSEKLFTQEDVNRIVGERLARVKSQATTQLDYSGREQELNVRELKLDAREKLADAGLPKDALPLVNCSSKKDMEESIKLIASLIRAKEPLKSGYRVVSSLHHGKPEKVSPTGDDEIRAAMGLKG